MTFQYGGYSPLNEIFIEIFEIVYSIGNRYTTNMQPFQLSLFTFGTQLSAFGKFVKVICLGLNCRGTQLTLFAFGTQFVLGLNLFRDSIVASPKR